MESPHSMDQQAKSMNVLLSAFASDWLNKDSSLAVSFAYCAEAMLRFLLYALPHILTTLTLAFDLLAVEMHPHSALHTSLDWVENLVVVTEAGSTASFQGVLLVPSTFVLLAFQKLSELGHIFQPFEWLIVVDIFLGILNNFEVIEQIEWCFLQSHSQVFIDQQANVLIIERLRIIAVHMYLLEIVFAF